MYHARRNDDRRDRSHPVTDRISNSKSNRIFLKLSTMCQQPVSAQPIKNNRTEQKEKLRRGVKQKHIAAVHVKAENNDCRKTAADAECQKQFAVAGMVTAPGFTGLYKIARVK